MKYLIVGLGNIGPQYELTRHNIGFLVLDRLAELHKAPAFSSDRLAFTTEFRYKNAVLHLIKPTTFMNLSGKAVSHWLNTLKIPKENMIVITDDLALPYGKLRIKSKGSNGGHNGLGNIQEVLGSQDYPRLRFGVGSNFSKGKQVDYVLSNFDQNEMAELPIHLDRCAEAIVSFCMAGIERTMNQFNTK